MRVVHVSPAAFGPDGVWGGGERYPLELATAMARRVPTRLVAFGARPGRTRVDDLEVVLLPARYRWRGGTLNPLSARLPAELLRGDVLHAHQWESVVTNAVVAAGALTGRPVFCTDHGGRSPNAARRLRLDRRLTGFLPVSAFSRDLYPGLASRATVIGGGVDPRRFALVEAPRSPTVVYVGRLLPHKGLDVLLAALPAGVALHVYGREYDSAYAATLRSLAAGRDVTFHLDATDADVVAGYRTARVAVLPSVYETPYGPPAPRSELLGLVLLEAMACGTPVVATRVGGMPEFVADGMTGLVVPPSDPSALRVALERLAPGGPEWERMSAAAVARVRAEFTWDRVAERCLAAYADADTRKPATSR